MDETGRIVRGDKCRAIPANLAPILDRLRINLDAWLSLMQSGGHFGLGSFGALASRAREALRRGVKWIVNTTAGLYRDDQPPEPTTAWRLHRPSISTTTSKRPTGRQAIVEQYHELSAARRLADPEDDRSRPNRAGFVLS